MRCLPVLDGMAPDPEALKQVAQSLAAEERTIYVHCAEGHGRTAMIAAALLLARGDARDATEAVSKVQRVRPLARLSATQAATVDALATGPEPGSAQFPDPESRFPTVP